MKRRRRTEILIKGSREIAQKLSCQITTAHDVKKIEEPKNGLVMVKVRETAKRSLFYLGEVFVTECKVQINGNLGIGIVKGHEPELAYNLAVIDAAYNADLKEIREWTEILTNEEDRINTEFMKFQNKVLATKVNFETMYI